MNGKGNSIFPADSAQNLPLRCHRNETMTKNGSSVSVVVLFSFPLRQLSLLSQFNRGLKMSAGALVWPYSSTFSGRSFKYATRSSSGIRWIFLLHSNVSGRFFFCHIGTRTVCSLYCCLLFLWVSSFSRVHKDCAPLPKGFSYPLLCDTTRHEVVGLKESVMPMWELIETESAASSVALCLPWCFRRRDSPLLSFPVRSRRCWSTPPPTFVWWSPWHGFSCNLKSTLSM